MQTEITKEDLDLLNDAAQCIDDCLMLIYPEEFYPKQVEEARIRFHEGRGIIARTATMANGLRTIVEKIKKGELCI